MVKGNLSLEIRCLTYDEGPISTPNASTNSNDPIDHSNPNFLGLTASTGKRKMHIVKHAIEPSIEQINRSNLSVLDKVNHEGS